MGLFAHLVGFDRDRAFYPVVLTVIASYYVLFAVMGNGDWAAEGAICAVFATAAVVGFRRSLWVVVAALTVHALFDGIRGLLIGSRGVPEWWPAFCLAYDLTAAAGLAVLLLRQRWQREDQPRPVISGPAGGGAKSSGATAAPGEPAVTAP